MEKLTAVILAFLLLFAVPPCAAADPEAPAIILPEGTELPEGIVNPEDPVELGSWGIPFTWPGDGGWYIYAHTEDNILLGLALFRPADPEAEAVDIPDGMETVFPFFFADMPNVNRVRLPESIRVLTMECFAGVRRDFVIECAPGSYAESFALEHGFQYDNGEKQVVGWQITDPGEKVKWVVANYVRDGMDETEKARVLHNWVITNSHYWSGDGSTEVYESDTLLVRGYGVCEAYAFAYYRLLKEAGMAVAWFTGETPDAVIAHDWNLVRIGGQWYHVDCTWDDPTHGPPEASCVSGQERDLYFLKTDAEMSADHFWDADYSADRGRMFSFWDPESGREMRRSNWKPDFTYIPNPDRR